MATETKKPLRILPHIPHLNVRLRHPLVGWQVIYATSNREKAQKRFDNYQNLTRGECDMTIVQIVGDQEWEIIHQYLVKPAESQGIG